MRDINLEKQHQGCISSIQYFLNHSYCTRFGGYHHGGHWGFNDYNRWRQQDGMLCRSTLDCTWMDHNMQCEDYELDFSMNVRNVNFLV